MAGIKRLFYLFIVTVFLLFTADLSAAATEKYDINCLSDCEKVCCDSSSCGAFAFGFSKNTVYTQSLVPVVRSCSFTAEGDFVGTPFLDRDTVCAVYMTADFSYHIMRINCLSGEVSYVNSDVIDYSNYCSLSVCNNRVYVTKTDEAYCYVSAYSFDGRYICDYRFEEKNVNYITTNNGCAYVILNDSSVYRLDENTASYCTRVSESSDFYNCGADFLADNKGFIYSLKENKVYTLMSKRAVTFAVCEDNVYYSDADSLNCTGLNGGGISEYKLDAKPRNILAACGKAVAISQDFGRATIVSASEFKSIELKNNRETTPENNGNSENNTLGNSTDKAHSYVFTNDGLLCNIKADTTVAQLKKSCPEIISVTDKDGNNLSGKLKTGSVAVTKDNSYTVAVPGDITGTGTVSSSDTKLLMQTFTGEKEIFGAYKKAADYNLDGSVDNKDLVLIAQGGGN